MMDEHGSNSDAGLPDVPRPLAEPEPPGPPVEPVPPVGHGPPGPPAGPQPPVGEQPPGPLLRPQAPYGGSPPVEPDSGRPPWLGILVVVAGLLVVLGVVAWKSGWLAGLSPFSRSSAPIETSIEPTASSGELLPAETFRWRYDNRDWELTMQIPEYLYLYYSRMERAPIEDYSVYVTHPKDDAEVTGPLAAELKKLATRQGYDAQETVNFTASFVQSLRYRTEEGEYPNYPAETLVDKAGDCEDTAILAAALLDPMGYDTVLIRFTSPVEGDAGHMAVGVSVTGVVSGGYSYKFEGGTYYYLETTSASWKLGQMPPDVLSKFHGTSDGIYALAPIAALRFSGSLEYRVQSRWLSETKVNVTVAVTNWGTASASDFYLKAYFKGHEIDAKQSATYDLAAGYKISNVAVEGIARPSGSATLCVELWHGGQVVEDWTADIA